MASKQRLFLANFLLAGGLLWIRLEFWSVLHSIIGMWLMMLSAKVRWSEKHLRNKIDGFILFSKLLQLNYLVYAYTIVSLVGFFFAFVLRPCLKSDPSPCFYSIWVFFEIIMILVQTMIIILSHNALKEINNKWFIPAVIFCLLAEAHALIPLKYDRGGNNSIELSFIVSNQRLEDSIVTV